MAGMVKTNWPLVCVSWPRQLWHTNKEEEKNANSKIKMMLKSRRRRWRPCAAAAHEWKSTFNANYTYLIAIMSIRLDRDVSTCYSKITCNILKISRNLRHSNYVHTKYFVRFVCDLNENCIRLNLVNFQWPIRRKFIHRHVVHAFYPFRQTSHTCHRITQIAHWCVCVCPALHWSSK